MDAPSGTVTFLFTDIDGSTRLWEASPVAMREALERHDAIVRGAIDGHRGVVFSTGGDGFAAAFARAGDALAAAGQAQAELAAEPWPADVTLRVRMGLHSGDAVERDGDYFGPAVNRAARLMAAAHGGQVVCSHSTAALAEATVALRNLGEHRLRDLGAAQQVFQLGLAVFPRLRSVDAVPTNLPTVRTDLIGRADEVAAVVNRLERDHLVTLTGVGGVGKTRLALAVAAASTPEYPDGCWLVELAPVADGGDVVKAVTAAVGASVVDLDTLVAYLSDRRMLLVLDNCEHLLADVAELVDGVLTAAPEIRVLATSREPLGLDGEVVRRVQSLSVPAADADAEQAATSEAVRLFVERATAVRERFAVTPDNVTAVVDVCRHLDGIPLAIELAAARVRAMPPAQIAARLDERFRLLAGGSRRAQERHRTLHAAVAWSYELLDEDEKVVFRRLAVFPASFDLAAAEAVVGDDGLDVLDCMVGLVDRSLVQFDDDDDRYRLLETLRQYGAERLADAGETYEIHGRHARHFLDVVERIGPELVDARYPHAHAVLGRELENLRAAAEWCIDSCRWAELLGMAHALHLFGIDSAPVDCANWYEQALEHADAPPQLVGDVMGEMAHLVVVTLADYTRAVALADRSLRLAEDAGLEESVWAWLAKSQVGLFSDRGPEGLDSCQRALAVAEQNHDEFTAAIALGHLANWYAAFGRAAESAAATEAALRRASGTGHLIPLQAALITAASNYLWTSQPDFTASLAVLSRHDDGRRLSDTMEMWLDVMWGATLVGLHDPHAVEHLARGIELADRQNAPHAADLGLRLLAIAAAEQGRRAEAATLAGYTDANHRAHRISTFSHVWIQVSLDAALAGMPDRDACERAGALSARRAIRALVSELVSAH